MTYDKFWMVLHKMGYQVKWEIEYAEILKDGITLAKISRKEQGSYTILEEGQKVLEDKVVMMILSLATTPLDERLIDKVWEMKTND